MILHGFSRWGGIGERVPHRRAPGAHGQTGGDCAPPVLLSVGERYPVRARASTTTSQFRVVCGRVEAQVTEEIRLETVPLSSPLGLFVSCRRSTAP